MGHVTTQLSIDLLGCDDMFKYNCTHFLTLSDRAMLSGWPNIDVILTTWCSTCSRTLVTIIRTSGLARLKGLVDQAFLSPFKNIYITTLDTKVIPSRVLYVRVLLHRPPVNLVRIVMLTLSNSSKNSVLSSPSVHFIGFFVNSFNRLFKTIYNVLLPKMFIIRYIYDDYVRNPTMFTVSSFLSFTKSISHKIKINILRVTVVFPIERPTFFFHTQD